jgi:hypothetical protein
MTPEMTSFSDGHGCSFSVYGPEQMAMAARSVFMALNVMKPG